MHSFKADVYLTEPTVEKEFTDSQAVYWQTVHIEMEGCIFMYYRLQ